jgi:hydroxymethylbilane synthase
MSRVLRIGTRGSQLALWQARLTARRISESGGPPCEEVVIRTSGDRLAEAPLSEAGGKRLFVKEIEEALAAGSIDLAVHSAKDMPVDIPEGLALAGVLPREDPHDAIILPGSARAASLEDLAASLGRTPRIGTSSVRRIAQLARLFPAARFEPIRGNLDTRLRKLDHGDYDALVLAAAGVRRLNLADRLSFIIPFEASVPAPGQGVIAIEARDRDDEAAAAILAISDPGAEVALEAERAVVAELGGGCQTPIGAVAIPAGEGQLDLQAVVASIDGTRVVRARERGPAERPARLGARVAAALTAQGAREILAEAERANRVAGGDQPQTSGQSS